MATLAVALVISIPLWLLIGLFADRTNSSRLGRFATQLFVYVIVMAAGGAVLARVIARAIF